MHTALRYTFPLGSALFLAACGGASPELDDSDTTASALSAEAQTTKAPAPRLPPIHGAVGVGSSASGTFAFASVYKGEQPGPPNGGCQSEVIGRFVISTCPDLANSPPDTPASVGTITVKGASGQLEFVPHAPDEFGAIYNGIFDPTLRLWMAAGDPVVTTYGWPNGPKTITVQHAPADIVVTRAPAQSISRNRPLRVSWTGGSPRAGGQISVLVGGGLLPSGGTAVTASVDLAPTEGEVTFPVEVLRRIPAGPGAFATYSTAVTADSRGLYHFLYGSVDGRSMSSPVIE